MVLNKKFAIMQVIPHEGLRLFFSSISSSFQVFLGCLFGHKGLPTNFQPNRSSLSPPILTCILYFVSKSIIVPKVSPQSGGDVTGQNYKSYKFRTKNTALSNVQETFCKKPRVKNLFPFRRSSERRGQTDKQK